MIPVGGVGCEIGVWRGAFSELLLERARPTALHLVDPWTFDADLPRAWYGGASAKSQADMDAIARDVRVRFDAQIADGIVIVHRGTSIDAADAFTAGQLDWVYIDGDHRYEAVRDELTRYGGLVRTGGVIAGDDYGDGGWWEGGVKRAVDEWCAARARTPTIIGSQFIVNL